VPKIRVTRINYAVAALVATAALIAIIVRVAESERSRPARCPAGLVALGARCCGIGQTLSANAHCVGNATGCADEMQKDDSGACVLTEARVALAGGTTRFGAADWDGPWVPPREVRVAAFLLDRTEVTVARFRACAVAGACPLISETSEPGRPVRNVDPAEASRFCAFAGGRLPTSAEWQWAAAGSSGRRYPWGNTGLVCRRASFGLLTGPCATSGDGPDLAGARPEGATDDGVQDLAGNVAEWTVEADGSFVARGGSYRSELASELKTWAFEARTTRAPHVGFRCAYRAPEADPGK